MPHKQTIKIGEDVQFEEDETMESIQYKERQKNSPIYNTILGSHKQTTEIDMYPHNPG
jgi:hypothetical protein